MDLFEKLGVQVPEILLPVNQIDFHKWAVIACDQFTSQPEYWKDVENLVGSSPSTLKIDTTRSIFRLLTMNILELKIQNKP